MAHAWWHFWSDEEESIFDPVAESVGESVEFVKDNTGALTLGLAGLDFARQAYDKVGEVGREAYQAYSQPGGLADVLSDRLEFRPYTEIGRAHV